MLVTRIDTPGESGLVGVTVTTLPEELAETGTWAPLSRSCNRIEEVRFATLEVTFVVNESSNDVPGSRSSDPEAGVLELTAKPRR